MCCEFVLTARMNHTRTLLLIARVVRSSRLEFLAHQCLDHSIAAVEEFVRNRTQHIVDKLVTEALHKRPGVCRIHVAEQVALQVPMELALTRMWR